MRDPRSTLGDLRAQIAACKVAERRVHELIRKYGLGLIQECMNEVMDYSEKKLRSGIDNLPEGQLTFTDYLEDGVYYDPVKIQINLEVKRSDITIDFTGKPRK